MPEFVSSSQPGQPVPAHAEQPADKGKPRRRWRRRLVIVGIIIALLAAIRVSLPPMVRWYVIDTINRSPIYAGEIADIDLHLLRGAYSIKEVRIIKKTGNVPVPLFAAKRVDLAIQWEALLSRRIVGEISMYDPVLNFVDAKSDSEDQTGAGGPWLDVIRDLFPFKINAATIKNGEIHFHAFDTDPPVDTYISRLEASVENLTNIGDDITPLVSTIKARGLAMDTADFDYEMKLNPFSYHPTFQLAVRLQGLNVTKMNALSRAYGSFDFEKGWFDLVVELDCKEGRVEGYVKPLFRNVQVLSLRKDIAEDNVFEFFWEALVGGVTQVLKNPPRDQVGTLIPLRGDMTSPRTDVFAAVVNILKNAFVRAYLPKYEGGAPEVSGLQFGPGSAAVDPIERGDPK